MPSRLSPHHETWYLSYESSREISLPSFDNSNNGRVFLQDGTIFHSPNCSRPAIIPPQTNYSSPPFNQLRLNSSMFKQPIWWTEFGGWLSFIPLAPSFTSTPFLGHLRLNQNTVFSQYCGSSTITTSSHFLWTRKSIFVQMISPEL